MRVGATLNSKASLFCFLRFSFPCSDVSHVWGCDWMSVKREGAEYQRMGRLILCLSEVCLVFFALSGHVSVFGLLEIMLGRNQRFRAVLTVREDHEDEMVHFEFLRSREFGAVYKGRGRIVGVRCSTIF